MTGRGGWIGLLLPRPVVSRLRGNDGPGGRVVLLLPRAVDARLREVAAGFERGFYAGSVLRRLPSNSRCCGGRGWGCLLGCCSILGRYRIEIVRFQG